MTVQRPTAAQRRNDYLAKAHEARLKAAETDDPHLHRTWRDIAESWQYLADQIERLGDI